MSTPDKPAKPKKPRAPRGSAAAKCTEKSTWTDEEKLQLIELVEQKPSLWKTQCSEWTIDQAKKNDVWTELGVNLSKSADDCKEQFRSLRVSFTTQLKKAASGSKGKQRKEWPFLQAMMYLKDIVSSAKHQDSIAGSEAAEHSGNKEPISSEFDSADSPASSSTNSESPTGRIYNPADAKKQKRKREEETDRAIMKTLAGFDEQGKKLEAEFEAVRNKKISDEDQFGMYIAMQLKELPAEERPRLKTILKKACAKFELDRDVPVLPDMSFQFQQALQPNYLGTPYENNDIVFSNLHSGINS